MEKKYKVAIFCGCFGKHPFGGPAIRMSSIGKMLLENGVDFKIFCNATPHPDYDIPGKVFMYEKFNKDEFNVFWVEQDWRYVKKLNALGINPIIGTNIIPNSASQHCLPYLYGKQKGRQEYRLQEEQRMIKEMKGKFWLSQSDFQEREFRKLGLPFEIDVLRAPNPVNLSLFCPTKKQHKDIIIGWTGKDNWQKHIRFLQEIASHFPEITFHYFSDETTDITFTKNVKKIIGSTNKQMPKHLKELSIFMSTSVSELQPLGVLEAQACGLPVIGFRTAGMNEIIEHNKTGISVDLGNIEHYIVELKRLLQDAKKRKQLGNNARKYVEKNFSYDACFLQYDKIFKKYLSEKTIEIKEYTPIKTSIIPQVNFDGYEDNKQIPMKESEITAKSKEHFESQWGKEYQNLSDLTTYWKMAEHLVRCTLIKPEEWVGKKVFEGGCGSGRNTLGALEMGASSIVATDLTDGGVASTIKNTIDFKDKVNGYSVDLTSLTEETDNCYQIVFSVNCVCHIPEWKKAVAEMVRICKPGGIIAFNGATQQPPRKIEIDENMRKHTTKLCKPCLKEFSKMMTYLYNQHDVRNAVAEMIPLSPNELSMYDHYGLPVFIYWTKKEVSEVLINLGCEILEIDDFISIKARKK